jgi:predicted phage terminase large subunit-like protein
MFLYARGELTGMVIASANEDKAVTLLSDIQAQFEANQLWRNDYRDKVCLGDWQAGNFATNDGVGFWAFGRGQSPRGIRKLANRPNYAVVDDIDDKVIVRNDQRVRDAVDWVMEDLYGALSINGARLIVAGNRIHQKSILANIVGDVEPTDPKRAGITHIKVYAFETKAHKKASPENGVPAWKERYTAKALQEKMERMGYRSSRREFFHEHIEEGLVFKNEWIQWRKPLRITAYTDIEVYCDPSFKNTKGSDYKAIVVVGKAGTRIDVLRAWVRQASITSMVAVFYDLHDELESYARYSIEANFLQDLLLDEFDVMAGVRGYSVPIRGDKRSKPDKYTRIENLSPLFERGLIAFNEEERSNPDMQTLVQQILAFPFGHDDAPDALEGAVFQLQSRDRSTNFRPRTGGYKSHSER